MTASFLVISEQEEQANVLCHFLLNAGYCVQKTNDKSLVSEIIEASPYQYYGIFLAVDPHKERHQIVELLKNISHSHDFPVFISKDDFQTLALGDSFDKFDDSDRVVTFDTIDSHHSCEVLKTIIQEQIEKQKLLELSAISLNGTLQSGHFKIRTIEQGQLLARHLASHCPKTDSVAIGLSELLINAIEHGNISIDYDRKTQLHREGRWIEEIHRLLNLEQNKDKYVQVLFTKVHNKITIEITDQGSGFNWRNYQQVDPSKLLESHGRGIVIARSLSFENMVYNEKGNQVTCTIFVDE